MATRDSIPVSLYSLSWNRSSILALLKQIRERNVSADNRRSGDRRSDGRSTRRAFLKGLAGSLGIATATRGRTLLLSRSADYDFRAVRNAILAAVGSHKATGLAVAVGHHGRIIWEEGFGWANQTA